MKKDQSKIHLRGNRNGKRVLLIHGMGFNWKNCFDKVLHILGKNYYFIIPELSGHNASSDGAVTSVIHSAAYISNLLQMKGINQVDTVYGISLGASIALELAFKGDIKINKLILDGGQYESMGNMKYIFSLIMAWQMERVLHGKHMMKYMQKQMGYLHNNDAQVLQPMGCAGITFGTLFQTALAAYKYDIRDREERISTEVVIMYGGNEIYAPNSVSLIERVSIYPVIVHACEDMGHAEALSRKPQKICNIIGA